MLDSCPPASPRTTIAPAAIAATTPLGRIGHPDEIAPAAVYLASDDSSWVTGETHYIAGGLHG